MHIEKLRGGLDAAGDASLQNGLSVSIAALKGIPPYGHREVPPPLFSHLPHHISRKMVPSFPHNFPATSVPKC